MVIFLFTDYGGGDLYAGQVKAVLARLAPGIPAIDLTHDAPAFRVTAGAHLLAALSAGCNEGDVVLAVVDPGVGSDRAAVALKARGVWYVGPDNGLLAVVAARAPAAQVWEIAWRPETITPSFHGRDLFAPMGAWLATGRVAAGMLSRRDSLAVGSDGADLAQIIYIDHFGNAMTGLRAAHLMREAWLLCGGQELGYARVFSDTPPGGLFWYENSLGLAEIAMNQGSAAHTLHLSVGQPVTTRW